MGLLDSLGKLLGSAKETIKRPQNFPKNLYNNTVGQFLGGVDIPMAPTKPINPANDAYYRHSRPLDKLLMSASYAQPATSQGVPQLPGRPRISRPLYPINLIKFPIPRNRFYEDEISPRQAIQPVMRSQDTFNGVFLQGSSPDLRFR